HISGSASAVVDALNLCPAMAECIENGPASGASAVKLGYMAIASGMCDCVLVIGGEMMRVVNGSQATDFVASMLHPEAEYRYGITLPSFAGMFTRLIMEKYGVTSRDLAQIAVKNHENAMHNPVAQIHMIPDLYAITEGSDAAAINPPVAEPLRRFDMCPVSDGAAAVLLCAMDRAGTLGFRRKPVRIAGIGQATDTHVVANRAVPTDLLAVRLAAQRAYAMAGMGPQDMDLAELHDAFLILEIVESEEVGFFPRGEGHLAMRRGETKIGGKIPINTSGGLKAKGHPLGATGVSQIVELVRQLRGEAEGRQVEGAKAGLAVNFGGFGNNVVATIVTKE
ncbi:MAG: thiolase family protein, partial [Oscillospiraceae bacterium]|nr:thiolase family protein [Oscillospiraceae bacterium]